MLILRSANANVNRRKQNAVRSRMKSFNMDNMQCKKRNGKVMQKSYEANC